MRHNALVRVAIDARYLGRGPSGIGGYTRALLERLPSLSPEDSFEAWLHPRVPFSERHNLRRRNVRSQPNNLPTLWWPAWLAPTQLDVLHAPFNILGRGLRCATVVTLHDLMWMHSPALCQQGALRRAVQGRFFRAGIGRALAEATRLVAISRATADAIAALSPAARARTVVIPHGVHPRHRPAGDREAAFERVAALGVERPFFLVVGQNAPYKNHEAVVQAFERSGLAPGVQLVIVERLGRKRSPAGVVRLAAVDGAELLALMQSALALVQFSRWEGFGLPALEAMACGAPVIVSDVPALREVVGAAAVVVPLEVRALSEAMRSLAAERSWRDDLSALGRARARHFSWEACALAHLEVYRQAAGC